jgi:hypothetical protein
MELVIEISYQNMMLLMLVYIKDWERIGAGPKMK